MYKVKRGKKEEYVYDDKQLQNTLVKLGLEGASLEIQNGAGDKEVLDTAGLAELIEFVRQAVLHGKRLIHLAAQLTHLRAKVVQFAANGGQRVRGCARLRSERHRARQATGGW